MNRLLYFVMLIGSIFPVSGQVYHVGDLYTAEDGSQGIVYYIHRDGSGWIVALDDVSHNAVWGIQGEDVPGINNTGQSEAYFANSLSDTAGYANTSALRAFQNNNPNFAAGMVDFDHGWYIPSAAQLTMLFAQLPFIEDKIIAAGGTTLAYDYYMSSTEVNNIQCVRVHFTADTINYFYITYSGSFFYHLKNQPISLRAVRSLHPLQNTYDTALTYSWSNGSTEPHFQDTPQQTTTYTVTVTTEYGCTNTASADVVVVSGEPQTLFDTICRGEPYNNYGFALTEEETDTAGDLSLTQVVSAGGCESEVTLHISLLSPDTFLFSQQSCQSFEWNDVTYTEDGVYTQHFTNVHGCDSLVMMDLTLNNAEISIITDGDFCDQSSLELLVETNANDFVWNTGEQTPQIIVVEPGVYSVVGTLNGCSDTAWVTVEPCEQTLYFPNTITPSRSDGLNDCFFLPEEYHPLLNDFEISIFNRWGTQVFYSTDKNFRWYGEYKGKTFNGAVFNYLVRFRDSRGKPHLLRGTVIVL